MTQLITSAQNFTASWADLGSAINMNQGKLGARVAIWLQIDINDTLNARVRALAMKGISDTLEYTFPISTVGTSDVTIEDEYFEFTDDTDRNVILEVVTNGLVPYIQFQISAGTAGASPGQIDSAYYSISHLA